MQFLQRRSLWVGSFLGVLSGLGAVLFASLLFVTPVHAAGESYRFNEVGDPANLPTTVTVTGGSANIANLILTRVENTSNYEGSTRNCAGETTWVLDVDDNNIAGGSVTTSFFSNQIEGPLPDPCEGVPHVQLDGARVSIAAFDPATSPPGCEQALGSVGYSEELEGCAYTPTGPNNDQCPPVEGIALRQNAAGENVCVAPALNAAGEEGQIRCSSENDFSWILCPTIDLMANLIQVVAENISYLLSINPLTVESGDGATFQVWSNLRNVANVFFVIVLFVIVFSQATSIALSAYGIKTLLPKAIVAAIAVNLSYFICAFMIDLFNVLGGGIFALFDAASVISAPDPNAGTLDGSVFGETLTNAVGGFIGGALVATGAIVILFSIGLGAAALAIVVGFLTIAARQALVVVLTVVSPIAIVLSMLPGTEPYYNKWKDLFANTLMMYPLMVAVMGGSVLASRTVAATAPSDTQQLIALLILLIPFITFPLLFKVAGLTYSRINSIARGYAQKANQGLDKTAYGRNRAVRKQAKEQVKQQRYLENAGTGKGVGGRVNRAAALIGSAPGVRNTTFGKSSQAVTQRLADAYLEDLDKQSKTHDNQLTRNSAELLAGSHSRFNGRTGMLDELDSSGNVIASHDIKTPGAVASGTKIDGVDISSLSDSDVQGLKYASEQGLKQQNLAGALAIGRKLSEQGALTSQGKANLINSVNTDQRSHLNSELNAANLKSGSYHVGYDNVQDGQFIAGGQKGGSKGTFDHIIASKGLQGVTKDMAADSTKRTERVLDPVTNTYRNVTSSYQDHVADYVDRHVKAFSSNPASAEATELKRQAAKMTDKQFEKMAKAVVTKHGGNEAAIFAELQRARAEGAKEYKS